MKKIALQPKPKKGRPTIFNEEISDLICARLMLGESLRKICLDEAMPGLRTVCDWILKNEAFTQQYRRAREVQAELMLDEIFEIADDTTQDDNISEEGYKTPNTEWITRSRLRVDARKWAMSKVLPKIYGDKQQVDVTSNGKRININFPSLGPEEKE